MVTALAVGSLVSPAYSAPTPRATHVRNTIRSFDTASAPFPVGSLLAFGSNVNGQLGSTLNSGTQNANPTPMAVSLPGAKGMVTQAAAGGGVAGGGGFSLALTSSGQLYAFGDDNEGQLGNANGSSSVNPTPALVTLPGAKGLVTQIAVGADHSLVLTSPGQVFAFGENDWGELGNATNNGTLNPNPTPTLVKFPGATGPITQISAGEDFSLALTSTGQLYAFGDNIYGELGTPVNTVNTINPTTGAKAGPNPTPMLVTLPGETGKILQISAGGLHSLVLTSTGQVFSFGLNEYGQLGIPDNAGSASKANPTPTLVTFPGAGGPIVQVAAGHLHSLALTSTGQMYAFGNNSDGALGIDHYFDGGKDPTPQLVTLPGETGQITQIAAGSSADESLALTSTGQLFAFGYNYFGALGNPMNNRDISDPAIATPTIAKSLEGTPIAGLAGSDHTLAVVGCPSGSQGAEAVVANMQSDDRISGAGTGNQIYSDNETPPAKVQSVSHTATGCPLTVTVKQLETPRSGLAVHSAHYNEFPVDFVDSRSGSPLGYSCESGCTDLVVKVVNPKTNKAVVGASVNASIGAIEGLTGDGYLCGEEADGQTATRTCGQYVSGLKTNSDGQVYIRYWLPGVDAPASSTLHVTAKVKCDANSCPARELEGSADPTTVTVNPYLIYQKTTPLSEDQVGDIAAWAGGTTLFTKFLKVSVAGPKVLTYALKYVKAFVASSEAVIDGLEAFEKVEPIGGALEVFQAFTELWEREAMIDMFLQVMDLKPSGIGDPPSEASFPKSTSTSFSNKIVNYGVVVPFNLGAHGAWWAIAQKLSKLKDDSFKGYGLKLKVYEVSTCEQGKDCDPGYANDPGSDIVLRDGIDPELAFYLTLTYQGNNLYNYNFRIPYDAIAWAETQPNLMGVIKDFN